MEKENLETYLEFQMNKCIRCDYKECEKKKENLEQLETSLQKMKNEKLQEISEITGIIF